MLTREQIITHSLKYTDEVVGVMNSKYYMYDVGEGKNIIPECFYGMPSPRQMYDDILFCILNGTVAKRGFEDEKKLKSYFFKSLSRNIGAYAKIYYLNNFSELTEDERHYWHEWTREFFDKILTWVNQEIKDDSILPQPQELNNPLYSKGQYKFNKTITKNID